MRAYLCDICKKLYTPYPVDGDYTGTNTLLQAYDTDRCEPIIYKKKYELCQDCCASFNVWLESRTVKRED